MIRSQRAGAPPSPAQSLPRGRATILLELRLAPVSKKPAEPRSTRCPRAPGRHRGNTDPQGPNGSVCCGVPIPSRRPRPSSLRRPFPPSDAEPVFILGSVRSGTSVMVNALRDGARLPGHYESNVASLMQQLIDTTKQFFGNLPEEYLAAKDSPDRDARSRRDRNVDPELLRGGLPPPARRRALGREVAGLLPERADGPSVDAPRRDVPERKVHLLPEERHRERPVTAAEVPRGPVLLSLPELGAHDRRVAAREAVLGDRAIEVRQRDIAMRPPKSRSRSRDSSSCPTSKEPASSRSSRGRATSRPRAAGAPRDRARGHAVVRLPARRFRPLLRSGDVRGGFRLSASEQPGPAPIALSPRPATACGSRTSIPSGASPRSIRSPSRFTRTSPAGRRPRCGGRPSRSTGSPASSST